MSKKTGGQGKGHTGKHSGGFVKHVVNSSPKHHPRHHKASHHVHHKHHVHVKGKHHHHARGYAVGDLLPVCTFEALAMSLRLAGQRVAEDDLLELWWLAGAREVSIAEALAAAARFGLAGCRPHQWPKVTRSNMTAPMAVTMRATDQAMPTAFWDMPLILGVDRPGPHAVLATPDGWWSWGELWSPWTRHVSEAWAVSWS